MTAAPTAATPTLPAVWFPDTSSLISLAVDDDLRARVHAELAPDNLALLDVVVDELNDLARPGGQVAHLAAAALTQLAWLGPPVDTTDLARIDQVAAVQAVIAGTRPLKSDRAHWAESVIMVISDGLTKTRPRLLSEDYDARVESRHPGMEPFSIHKVLAVMVRADRLPHTAAASFADALHKAGRGPHCLADEFRTGRLGWVGQP